MKSSIPHLPKRPTIHITQRLSCIHTTLKRYASQGQPTRRPFINHNSSPNSRRNDSFGPNNDNRPKGNPNNPKSDHGDQSQTSRQVTRYIHQPRQRWMNVNPSRASINIYRHDLLSVQYCSAVLLLRTQGILLNPFHPLLRTALQRHQETYEIGYFFHLHTSSKLVTGKQSSVRKGIRGKVRAAWEQVLTKRGYDVKTGRFTRHLKPGFDRSKGHVVLPDIRGTVSINPSEACSNAQFQDILAACESGLEAVLRCKHRNLTMEEWMKPSNLWKFYDWRRRDLLNKYMTLGHGLGASNRSSQIFRSALIGLRTGKATVGMSGKRTPEGGYLVELDGETFDLAPLRGPAVKSTQPGQEEFNDDDTKLFQEAFEKGDANMDGLFAEVDSGDGDGLNSGDLDWGLDDIEPEDNSEFGGSRPRNQRKTKYLDDF